MYRRVRCPCALILKGPWSGSAHHAHLVLAGLGGRGGVEEVDGENHVHALVDGEQTSIALWTPGSFVGAVLQNDKPVLFLDQVTNDEAHLCAFTCEGSAWSLLGEVTKSS